jgi:IS4 transposase
MPVEAGATYVFDKGYYDFGFWARLAAVKCRFVTRLKKNSPTRLVRERQPRGSNILFDQIVRLSERLSHQRCNPYQGKVRLIGVKIDTGREITLLTNDLKAPAEQIAALYKQRWQIELFFKWLKQNLAVRHFIGTSRNAVTIQVMAALIGYLLLRIAALGYSTTTGLQALARLMPAVLLTRRPIEQLFRSPPVQQPQTGQAQQLSLAYA